MNLAKEIAEFLIDADVYMFDDIGQSKEGLIKETKELLIYNAEEVRNKIIECQDFTNRQQADYLLNELFKRERRIMKAIDKKTTEMMLKNGQFVEQRIFEELGDMEIKPICNYTMFKAFVEKKGTAAFSCIGELRFIIEVKANGIYEYNKNEDGVFNHSNPYIFLTWEELGSNPDADFTDVFALDGTAFGYWDFKERII